MEAKILSLITKLQLICLPWDDGTPIDENDWYYIADNMAEILPDFLRYAKQDYALQITPPLIIELAKWLTTVMSICPKDTQHQFAEFWNELFWESYLWMGWIKQYYPTLSENRELPPKSDLCEPAEVAPPTPQDVAQPLPTSHPLNSPRVQLIFEELNKQGYVAKYGSKWEWKAGAGLYGYFVVRMSNVFNLHKVKDESRLLDWALFSKVILNGKKLQQSAMSSNARKGLLYNDEPPQRGKYTELYAIIGN